ncbi:recombinase family protein [Nonomuraea sp. NPDC000554]|uniref:recombinase family protein n=1 Tax=Nonomuraea sp. NPDC000554 TaxID=3154259 RepID=UPI0033189CF1
MVNLNCDLAHSHSLGVWDSVGSRTGEPFRAGYCRCSTDQQDVELQTDQLLKLGVPRERIFIDKGFSGPTRKNRVGLENALAADTSAVAAGVLLGEGGGGSSTSSSPRMTPGSPRPGDYR